MVKEVASISFGWFKYIFLQLVNTIHFLTDFIQITLRLCKLFTVTIFNFLTFFKNIRDLI